MSRHTDTWMYFWFHPLPFPLLLHRGLQATNGGDWVFWSQQWNICFNSFILGLQVGILNQIQSNLVGKPVCVCVCVCVHACVCVRAQLCPTLCNPMGSAYQAPLSMEFSRQEDWSVIPCPGDGSCVSSVCLLHWQVDSLPLSHLCSCYYLWTEY